MIVELDDFHEHSHRMDLLVALREANPLFRCTVFAVPYLSPDSFLESLPDWVEVAVHGWDHRHRQECASWTRDQAVDVLLACSGRFVDGFKATGYHYSPGLYEALLELDWWAADRGRNDDARPYGLRTYRCADGAYVRTDVGGLSEYFPLLLAKVRQAPSFELVSEVAVAWQEELVA